MMKNFWNILTLSIALVLAASLPVLAQTTTNTTTFNEAVDATETTITITSATGVVAGDYAYADGEAMLVTAADTTANTIDVQRGVLGTAARAHISGQLVYIEQPGAFVGAGVRRFGACTATDYDYLPEINPVLAEKYACKDGQWVLFQLGELINATHSYGATVADHVLSEVLRPVGPWLRVDWPPRSSIFDPCRLVNKPRPALVQSCLFGCLNTHLSLSPSSAPNRVTAASSASDSA